MNRPLISSYLAAFVGVALFSASAQAQIQVFNLQNAPAPAAQAQPAEIKSEPKTDAAKPPDAPAAPVTTTIDGERIAAQLVSLADGKLTLATEPARTIEMASVERVQLGVGPGLSVIWIGQDNSDVAQASNTSGSNKIQDLHLRLEGIPAERQFKQIVAVSRDANVFVRLLKKDDHQWKLDPGQSEIWRMVVDRADDGASPTAEVYLEPAAQDSFDRDFAFTITYDDGTTANVTVRAKTHSNNKAPIGGKADAAPMGPAKTAEQAGAAEPTKVSPETNPGVATPGLTPATPTSSVPAVAASDEPTVTVYLEGRDVVHGHLSALDDRSLSLTTDWPATIKIPLLQVVAIRAGLATSADAGAQFDKLRRKQGEQDVALVIGADGVVTQIAGLAKSIEAGKLQFEFDGESRPITMNRLSGLIFSAHPPVKTAAQAATHEFQLASGDIVTGLWKALDAESFTVDATWGETIKFPKGSVREILLRNGRVVYLSDLEPVTVDEIPYFGKPRPFRRDRSLAGGALRIKGKDFPKGLAVHSRSLLTYALDGQFDAFQATVGFDDDSKGRGRVALRVVADGKELISKQNLRGDEDPLPLDLAVAGVKELSLEVDFGEAEDIGDRVIWGGARLMRKAEQ